MGPWKGGTGFSGAPELEAAGNFGFMWQFAERTRLHSPLPACVDLCNVSSAL